MEATDLTNFVSRPELKVPQLMLKKHHPDQISPGYIFMAPYVRAEDEAFTKYYRPCQVGPNIYDSDGELVWSGACIFSNRNTYDFKLNRDGGNATTLSVIVGPILNQPGGKGFGAIIGPSLEVEHEERTTSDIQGSYMHEFSVIDGGNTALYIHAEYREANVTEISKGNKTQWTVRNEGFREVDLRDGSISFQWWAMDHIPIEETFDRPPLRDGEHYDVYHINSLERTAFGHYIVSMRHTNTIYLISGLDGHVIWRLGGLNSSFVHLDSFNFSAQHDARILSEHTNGTFVMSFFDNAGATGRPMRLWTARNSSAVIVKLDTAADPMTVGLLRKYERPDGGVTMLRGNAQVLPNGNVLGGWSSSGYFSESTEDGTMVLQGNLGSTRTSTYRTYKFGIDEVKLFPAEPIALVCRTLQISDGPRPPKLSVMYVSWNGATEVKQWKFAVTEDAEADGARFTVIGSKEKQGFETVAQLSQGGKFALAYGLDQDGIVLRKSAPVQCMNIVEAGSISHQFEDPIAYHRHPGTFTDVPAVTDPGAAPGTADEINGNVFHEHQEGEAEGSGAKESTSAATSDDETENKTQQKQPATEAASAGNAPPRLIDVGGAFMSDTSPRPLTIMLFSSVALAGVLLMMRRLRRRIL